MRAERGFEKGVCELRGHELGLAHAPQPLKRLRKLHVMLHVSLSMLPLSRIVTRSMSNITLRTHLHGALGLGQNK